MAPSTGSLTGNPAVLDVVGLRRQQHLREGAGTGHLDLDSR